MNNSPTESNEKKSVRVVSQLVSENTAEAALEAIEDSGLRSEAFEIEEVSEA